MTADLLDDAEGDIGVGHLGEGGTAEAMGTYAL